MSNPVSRFLLNSCQALRFNFLLIFVVAVIASALDSFYPYWVKALIDHLLQSRSVQAYEAWKPFVVLACIWLLKECLHRSTTLLSAMIFPRYRMLLRLMLAKKMLGKTYEYFLKKTTGTISSRLDLIVTTSEKILSALLLNYLGLLINLVVTIVLLMSVDISFIFLVLSWLVYHCGVTLLFLRNGGGYSKLQARANAHLAGKITDVIINFFAASCFNAQKFLFSYIIRQQKRAVQIELKTSWHFEKLKICQSIGALCLLFGALFLLFKLSRNPGFAVGNIPMVLMLVGSFLASFWTVVDQFSALFNNLHQLGDAVEFLQIVNAKEEKSNQAYQPQVFKALEFKNVDFAYEKSTPVIQRFSLICVAQQKILIQATNGRGKTTLLCVLAGLLFPTAGHVFLNDLELTANNSQQLQQQVLLLLAKPVILNRTLLDNVRLVDPRASVAEVMLALEYADCGFIRQLPMGIYTVLKEEGRNLSHGQRQRLSLARAFLSPASILLLDEPFANIDTISRDKILLNLFAVCRDKAIIIADHQKYNTDEFSQIIHL